MGKSEFSGSELNAFKRSKVYFMEIPIRSIILSTLCFVGALVTLVYPFTEASNMTISDGIAYTILQSLVGFVIFYLAIAFTNKVQKVSPEHLVSYKGVMGKHTFRSKGDERKVKLTTSEGDKYFKCDYAYYQMFLGELVDVFAYDECIYVIRRSKK